MKRLKYWVLFLKDGTYQEIKADTKDEAKKIAYEKFGIVWYEIASYELYYK